MQKKSAEHHAPDSIDYESRFGQLYASLNGPQKAAVDAIEGPVMVIAGPGTGKTTILTLRIANILKQTDCAPENILALTFTESGAFAMRKKLLSIIGPSAYKVNIQTFHGFCESIIQAYPDYFPRIIGSSIVSDADQLKIVEKIIHSREIKVLRPYGDPGYYVKPCLQEIQILKRENISPVELKKGTEKEMKGLASLEKKTEAEKLEKRTEKNLELAFVYAKYEEELARQKYYDFDDMLLELIRSIEKSREFKLILQENFQYILADEHQDANASQNRILELLSDFHESPNLFIVGDDKQAIYRFQGASLDNFLYFSKKFKGATVIDLEHNYRSHQGILDASHGVISRNPSIPGRERKRLRSLQVGSKPIYISEFSSQTDELEYVAEIIERMIGKGEKSEEITVLYRENKDSAGISSFLSAHGIPHRIESDYDILGDIDAVKIMTLCRAISDPSDSEKLGKALLIPEMGCDPADVSEACAMSARNGLPLHSYIKTPNRPALNAKGNPKPVAPVRKAYDAIVEWNRLAQTVPFTDFLEELIQGTGMLTSVISDPNSLERLSSLEAFFGRISKAAHSKKTFRLSDFIEYIDVVSEHGLMAKRSFTENSGGVRLMTAHRAKGLEFNHVFIINFVDGSWGNRIKREKFKIPMIEHARDGGRVEDERRLFYVALTRARQSVNISYSLSDGQKELAASQFLVEIEPSLVSFEKPKLAGDFASFVSRFKPGQAKPADSVIDPDFVRSKFLSQPFSVTHLNNYLECPWKYFFMNLIRIPQAQSKHQMYGTAVHASLRAYFDAYKEENDMDLKQLLSIFKHNLEMQPFSERDREDSWKKGKDALTGYIEKYHSAWNRKLLTEYSVKSSLRLAYEWQGERTVDLPLTGKIDKVELLSGGEADVTDFKTSKPKSRNEIEGKTKDSNGNYKRQLVFYKLLIESDGRFRMRSGEIDFIEPNERGAYKKERFEIDAEEVEDLKKAIKDAANGVLGLSFTESKCKDKKCEYCRLGKALLDSRRKEDRSKNV